MKNKIGIMQGRLVPREIKSRIQSFPFKNWKKEIILLKKKKIKFIEWTIDYRKFLKNPLIEFPMHTKMFLKKNNVKCNSITADFFMQQPAWKNKKTDFYLKKLSTICEKLKIKFIIIPLVDNSSIKNNNENQIIEYFRKLNNKNYFNKNTKVLFELDLPPKKVKKFLKKVGKNYGINYDTGNSAYHGYNFKNEMIYFNKVYNIHIKDRKKGQQSISLGKGDFNFKIFFRFVKKIRYNGNLILQTYMPKKDKCVISETLKNLEFIKKNV